MTELFDLVRQNMLILPNPLGYANAVVSNNRLLSASHAATGNKEVYDPNTGYSGNIIFQEVDGYDLSFTRKMNWLVPGFLYLAEPNIGTVAHVIGYHGNTTEPFVFETRVLGNYRENIYIIDRPDNGSFAVGMSGSAIIQGENLIGILYSEYDRVPGSVLMTSALLAA